MLRALIQDIEKGGLYRFVRYGIPEIGEHFLNNSGGVGVYTVDSDAGIFRAVLERFIPKDDD